MDSLLGVYELNRIELLRDVFVWSYGRSCQQYIAVKRDLVPPNPFRLRMRIPLAEAVNSIIRQNLPITESVVKKIMPESVSLTDQNEFVQLVVNEFNSLHAGNSIRFGIRPLEFETWKQQHFHSRS